VQPHGIARILVQYQGEEIEVRDLMQPVGQIMEQRRQIAVGNNRF
jgi:hypothetical protein